MTSRTYLKFFGRFLPRLMAFAAVASSAVAIGSSCAGEAPGAPPEGASAQRVHIDPATGTFIDTPPRPVDSTRRPLSVEPDTVQDSHDGLVEVPNPVPGGGVVIDLRGRFQHPLRATRGTDEKIYIEHQ
jgi:hypothetical protein